MVFSVCLQCLRWHPLRTKNIHCIQFSVCFGSHALRTKNIHCIQRVFALARFKNEEYTSYSACVCARTLLERGIYIVFSVCLASHALRAKNIHCIQRVFALARFKNEEYTLYLGVL